MHMNAQTHSNREIFHTSIFWIIFAHENTHNNSHHKEYHKETLLSSWPLFICLRNLVTKLRVVKRTRHKKQIDRLPVCVLKSFELSFIGLICGVRVWASLAVVRLKEVRLRSLTVFPCCVFCRIPIAFLRRNRRRTTRIPWFHHSNYVINTQWI